MKSTPTDALRYDAGVPPYTTRIARQGLRSAEKSFRVPDNHPLAEARKNAVVPKRGQKERRSWKAAEVRLDALNADVIIYTDGSASEGTTSGGAGVVVTVGRAEHPLALETIMLKGAAITSSCEEEIRAAEGAIEWINNNPIVEPTDTVLIATDSQSMCKGLIALNPEFDTILNLLDHSPCCSVVFQWVPGHVNIAGNELADEAAKHATKLEEPHQPTAWNAIAAEVNRIIPPQLPTHKRCIAVYSFLKKSMEASITSREDQVEIGRLRSGHHLGLGRIQHKYKMKADPSCHRCGHGMDDLEHWLTCDGTLAARMRIFGECNVGLSALAVRPRECIALARETFRGAGLNISHR